MFKFELDQLIFYMIDNKVYSAKVLSRTIVENLKQPNYQKKNRDMYEIYCQFGYNMIMYSTTHGKFEQHKVFASKQELLDQL